MQKIEKLLQILKEAGLTLNLKKRIFGANKVNFVGLELSMNGIGPGERKVRAIIEFPTPRNVHKARRFHGMASFFRRFLPGFAREVALIVETFKGAVHPNCYFFFIFKIYFLITLHHITREKYIKMGYYKAKNSFLYLKTVKHF